MTPGECRAAFAEADVNGDGVLSPQEVANADLDDTEADLNLEQFMADCQS